MPAPSETSGKITDRALGPAERAIGRSRRVLLWCCLLLALGVLAVAFSFWTRGGL